MSSLRTELLESYRAGNFLQKIYESSLDRNKRQAIIGELAAMHDEGEIDFVHAFESLKNDPSARRVFFPMREIFEQVLAKISAPAFSVMQCVVHLHKEAGRDLGAATIIDSFIAFCKASKTRPHEALREIEKDPQTFAYLLPATIAAGLPFDQQYFCAATVRLCADTNPELRSQAIFTLGTLANTKDINPPDDAISIVENAVAKNTDDATLVAAVRSAFPLSQYNKNWGSRAVSIVADALHHRDSFTLHAASEIFGHHTQRLSPALLEILVTHLRHVLPENMGTLQNIDLGLSNLLTSSQAGTAISLLEELLLTNPQQITLEVFSLTANTIRTNSALFNKTVTRWFFKGARPLCIAIEHLADGTYSENLRLEIDPTEFQPADSLHIEFIAHKALGYLFVRPVPVASLLISLMHHTIEDSTLALLTELLFNPLLLNFPGGVREYLIQQSQTESGRVKTAIENALKALDKHIKELNSIGTVPALHPSEAQREAFRRHFSQQMKESMKAAEEMTPLLTLMPKSILLYGARAIHYVNGPAGNKKRFDTPLKKLGTTLEIPRLESLDPFGLEYMLRVFRAEFIQQ